MLRRIVTLHMWSSNVVVRVTVASNIKCIIRLLVISASDWSHSSRCFLCNVGLIVLQVSALLYALCPSHHTHTHRLHTHSPHTHTHTPHTHTLHTHSSHTHTHTQSTHTVHTHSPHTHTHSAYRLKVILAMVRRVHLVYLRRIWESSVTKLRHVKYEGVFSFARINAIIMFDYKSKHILWTDYKRAT